MNIKVHLRLFLTIILILLPASADIFAQIVIERSKDKVIISGIQYYIHLVKKGETAYSISKAYNVTLEELNRENPSAVSGLKEGQSLKIPVREAVPASQASPSSPLSPPSQASPASPPSPATGQQPAMQRDESKYYYHRIQPGQTIYSLSKLYDVPEAEILAANPGIDISRLPVYSEIAVPKKETLAGRESAPVRDGAAPQETGKTSFTRAVSDSRTVQDTRELQDKRYMFHKVEAGESLASIAEKYGVTLRELRRENRNVKFPQVGDYLRIPESGRVKFQLAVTEQPAADTTDVQPADTVMVYERPEGYTPVGRLAGTFNVAVLLPFYLAENAIRMEIDSSKYVKGKVTYRPVKRLEDWIYYRSAGFVEMYEGILLAADTLRSLGLNINLHAFDIKSDTIEVTRLINRGQLAGMDLIIGPVYSRNLAIVSEYARKLNIPVVSPVRLMNNSALVNNPLLFMANASLEVAQDAIAREASDYYLNNFIFIHADTSRNDPDVSRFRQKILSELSSRIPRSEIRFRELAFYSRSAFNSDSVRRLENALSARSENLIIIASEDDPVVSETLQEIHSLSKKYPVRIIGYPSMRGIENLDPKFIFELGVLVLSPFWIDYSEADVSGFIRGFRKKFLTEPSEMSYAWIGYDLTYYFLSGLAIHGRDFLSYPWMHNPDLLQTEFDFRRKGPGDGFENYKLYRVKYTQDYEVVLEAGEPEYRKR